jgi:hypothetical protein
MQGTIFRYHRKLINSIGERVSLTCSASIGDSKVLRFKAVWMFNEQHVVSNQSKIKTEFQTMQNGWMYMNTTLTIDSIENSDFGNYSCLICGDLDRMIIKRTDNCATEWLIGQYNVQKYRGKVSFIYAAPGSAIHLIWKPMFLTVKTVIWCNTITLIMVSTQNKEISQNGVAHHFHIYISIFHMEMR